jgi:hypothetical protein
MTKIVAVILTIICVLLAREGIRCRNIATPPDYITTVRYFGGALFLFLLAIALFTTDKSLLELFSFLRK